MTSPGVGLSVVPLPRSSQAHSPSSPLFVSHLLVARPARCNLARAESARREAAARRRAPAEATTMSGRRSTRWRRGCGSVPLFPGPAEPSGQKAARCRCAARSVGGYGPDGVAAQAVSALESRLESGAPAYGTTATHGREHRGGPVRGARPSGTGEESVRRAQDSRRVEHGRTARGQLAMLELIHSIRTSRPNLRSDAISELKGLRFPELKDPLVELLGKLDHEDTRKEAVQVAGADTWTRSGGARRRDPLRATTNPSSDVSAAKPKDSPSRSGRPARSGAGAASDPGARNKRVEELIPLLKTLPPVAGQCPASVTSATRVTERRSAPSHPTQQQRGVRPRACGSPSGAAAPAPGPADSVGSTSPSSTSARWLCRTFNYLVDISAGSSTYSTRWLTVRRWTRSFHALGHDAGARC
jgi:hypothetical protein